jgi:indole-3-glycerol phosphate synthase
MDCDEPKIMTTVLEKICADKRLHVEECKQRRPLAQVKDAAKLQSPVRGFYRALADAKTENRYGLIAEIKKASPSKGVIRANFDPPAHARAYELGGATCLSILTDVPYFQGADDYLVAARAACSLPSLRKDFTIDTYQIHEARALGADAILLIMAALSDAQASEFELCALELGLDVLVEIHDEVELERALNLKSPLLGINNRNLKSLDVSTNTAHMLAAKCPADRLIVGESGLRIKADLDALAAQDITTFLVGEALMAQNDVTAATRALLFGKP